MEGLNTDKTPGGQDGWRPSLSLPATVSDALYLNAGILELKLTYLPTVLFPDDGSP